MHNASTGVLLLKPLSVCILLCTYTIYIHTNWHKIQYERHVRHNCRTSPQLQNRTKSISPKHPTKPVTSVTAYRSILYLFSHSSIHPSLKWFDFQSWYWHCASLYLLKTRSLTPFLALPILPRPRQNVSNLPPSSFLRHLVQVERHLPSSFSPQLQNLLPNQL